MMKMRNGGIKNASYLLVFAPCICLVVGTYSGIPWLSVLFFFGILPLAREIIGDDLSTPNKKPKKLLCLYFHTIPRLYCAAWIVILPWTIWLVATKPMSTSQYIWFALGLWIVSALNTAVAHELIHDRNKLDRLLGNLLDASVGYTHFAEEHINHHTTNGHYLGGDAAVPGTSLYRFACRRYIYSLCTAWEYELERIKRAKKNWLANRLLWKAMIPLSIAMAFYGFAGKVGLAIYIFQIAGAAFIIQVITYLQHWGVTEKETPILADFGFTWEDGCWIQACVTLNHAFHGQHHLRGASPYHELELVQGGLRLPASYPVMLVIAFFPTFFTKIMTNTLKAWIENHEMSERFAHDSDCIGMRRILQSLMHDR